MPALLTRMSMRPPSSSLAWAARFCEASGEPSRSIWTKSACPPCARISSTTSAPRCASRPLTTTCAPSRAKATAIARPMLLVAPVTSAVFSCNLIDWTVQSNRVLTKKGEATRTRIVGAAADLVLERGAAGTALDDICGGTKTSRSQLFHYFPDGKAGLVLALAAFQAERVLDAQRPWLEDLSTWESWDGWRAS